MRDWLDRLLWNRYRLAIQFILAGVFGTLCASNVVYAATAGGHWSAWLLAALFFAASAASLFSALHGEVVLSRERNGVLRGVAEGMYEAGYEKGRREGRQREL